jgi:hypothetical protein
VTPGAVLRRSNDAIARFMVGDVVDDVLLIIYELVD